MNQQTVSDTLGELAFFRGLADSHLQQIADLASCVEFPQGRVIFREGEPATQLYIIVSGTVSLEICAPAVGCKRILTVTDGELLGWSPVLERTRLTATARSITPTTAVALDGTQVLTLCEHNPRLGYEFMRRAALALAKRLKATRMQLLDVFGSQLPSAESDDDQ